MGVVDVKHTREDELTLEWESSVTTDMIADSTLALLLGIESSPASVKRECLAASIADAKYYSLVTFSPHSHHHADLDDPYLIEQKRYECLTDFLKAHFGNVELRQPENIEDTKLEISDDIIKSPEIIVRVDDFDAHVNLIDLVSPVPREWKGTRNLFSCR